MGKVVKVDDTHIHTCTTETRQNVFLLTFTATNRLRCSKLKKLTSRQYRHTSVIDIAIAPPIMQFVNMIIDTNLSFDASS